jgi:hypothetical protein
VNFMRTLHLRLRVQRAALVEHLGGGVGDL